MKRWICELVGAGIELAQAGFADNHSSISLSFIYLFIHFLKGGGPSWLPPSCLAAQAETNCLRQKLKLPQSSLRNQAPACLLPQAETFPASEFTSCLPPASGRSCMRPKLLPGLEQLLPGPEQLLPGPEQLLPGRRNAVSAFVFPYFWTLGNLSPNFLPGP